MKTDNIHKQNGCGAKALHEVLIADGHTPHHNLADRKELSLKEKRTKYVMRLNTKLPTVSFQVDGRIITSGNKCDFVILIEHNSTRHQWKEVFVELKGTDVEHAIAQIEASVKADILKHSTISEVKARIVALSFPSSKSNPKMELAKRHFRKDYNCELKSVKSERPDLV